MNFGQALAALLSRRSITRAGWQRQGTSLTVQEPIGMVTQSFIVQQAANGECTVYTPTQTDLLATDWQIAGEGERAATQTRQEHAPAAAGGH